MRVAVVTYLPSPYQVELFNAVHRARDLELQVIYLKSASRGPIARHWQADHLEHPHVMLDREGAASAHGWLERADLVVFNYYRDRAALQWMQRREKAGASWCFWGERPGATRWAPVGDAYRYFRLATLRRSRAAIWGIGQLAVDRYRAAFGARRKYFNVPYFSDLWRFAAAAVPRSAGARARKFLFSGALIRRKGVDLLVDAFARVRREVPDASLTFVGTGELERGLKARLARHGARFAGFQPWDALPGLYGGADVLVAPSRHDGWAMVVPEALASGLPVISTARTGAAREFIEPGRNGWIVEPPSAAALGSAMLEASRADLGTLARAARASVAHHQLADGVARFTAAAGGSVAA
ncbi:MAG: glycosyltransferase [Steroidobacteraceae bacterium]